MKYVIIGSDDKNLINKTKKKLLSEIKDGTIPIRPNTVEIKFTNSYARIRDTETFEVIARYYHGYKSEEESE